MVAKAQNIVNTDAEIQQELKNGRFTSSILISHRWLDWAELDFAELAKWQAQKKRGS